jgi:hypothetical protein
MLQSPVERFSFILPGCETWSLTLTVEQRLEVFENGVQRKIRHFIIQLMYAARSRKLQSLPTPCSIHTQNMPAAITLATQVTNLHN